MALLAQATLNYLESLLVNNPSRQNFPELNFQDYPLSLYPSGVPRSALLNAFQALCDQAKYDSSGNVFPIDYNPAKLLTGTVTSTFPNQGTGLPNQAPKIGRAHV